MAFDLYQNFARIGFDLYELCRQWGILCGVSVSRQLTPTPQLLNP